MTELMNIIKGRRSIRKYEDKEVPDDFLQQILESVRWSPSWANTQCWEVIVVRDSETKEKLQVRYPNCEHDFPPEIRQEAYAFLDAALNSGME